MAFRWKYVNVFYRECVLCQDWIDLDTGERGQIGDLFWCPVTSTGYKDSGQSPERKIFLGEQLWVFDKDFLTQIFAATKKGLIDCCRFLLLHPCL